MDKIRDERAGEMVPRCDSHSQLNRSYLRDVSDHCPKSASWLFIDPLLTRLHFHENVNVFKSLECSGILQLNSQLSHLLPNDSAEHEE